MKTMNNQQNSNGVSDDFLAWLDEVIRFLKESIFMGGECDDMQIRLMEQIRHKYVSLNSGLNTINEPINDKEIDAEIERYIQQFWPRPEHGGAVRLGFKRAVRWMQERQSNEPISQHDYELISRGRFDNPVPDNVEPVKNDESLSKAQVDYYEDKIEMLQRLLSERDRTISELNEPVTDEEALKEKFWVIISESNRENDLGTAGKCVRICKQYVASKLNNTIEDKSQLLCVGRRVKVDTEYYTVTSAMELSDSVLFNLQKSNGSLRVEIKK